MKKLLISDELDFSIAKHYLTSEYSIANYKSEFENGMISIHNIKNIIVIHTIEVYKKIRAYFTKIGIRAKFTKEI